jgi:hypothetical protein
MRHQFFRPELMGELQALNLNALQAHLTRFRGVPASKWLITSINLLCQYLFGLLSKGYSRHPFH